MGLSGYSFSFDWILMQLHKVTPEQAVMIPWPSKFAHWWAHTSMMFSFPWITSSHLVRLIGVCCLLQVLILHHWKCLMKPIDYGVWQCPSVCLTVWQGLSYISYKPIVVNNCLQNVFKWVALKFAEKQWSSHKKLFVLVSSSRGTYATQKTSKLAIDIILFCAAFGLLRIEVLS